MQRFWDLLAQSVIVQGILTVGVTFFVCVLAVKQLPVEKEFWTLLGLAWGFYFGSKAQQQVTYMARTGLEREQKERVK